MEITEAVGFIQFWGMTPPINFLEDQEFIASKKKLNVLLSGVSDLRYLLKTLLEICLIKDKFKDIPIRIYFHDTKKENIARCALLLHVLNLTNLSHRERIELFLDIYGNCFVKEKTSDFISDSVKELTRLFTDELKCQLPIKKLFDLSLLKSKDRDDFLEIFTSWLKTVPFKMDELRDNRLRYHYKDRYDVRANMIDWDYQMELREDAPVIHFFHYKHWRQTGVAFEQRFSSHIIPNRTMGSYVPGRTKKGKDSCLVRGYWGDIIISPYLTFGIETDIEPEKTELYKVFNMQQKYTSVDITNFNLYSYLKMFEQFEVHHLPKEEEQPQQQPEKKKEMEKIEEKPEEEEKEQPETEIQTTKETKETAVESKIEEREIPVSEIKLMEGFTTFDLKILPICEELDKLVKKSNLKQCFDIIVLGIPTLSLIKEEELPRILSNDALLYLETPKFMVPIKKKERPEMIKNLAKFPEKFDFKPQPFAKDHHLKFRRIFTEAQISK